jgi:hypothetical protein
METVSPLDKDIISRRVKSYEGNLHGYDYDSLNFQQFHKGPFYNADYDVVSEGGGSPNFRSKVRYNDTGSLEEINSDAAAEMLDEIVVDSLTSMDDNNDDTETLNGAQKYRDLWNLRATFEEEESEDFSDTIRMDDATSPDRSPDHEQAMASVTTSFESYTEPVVYMDNELLLVSEQMGCKLENLLHPNYENRRQTYKSILSKRLKKIDVTCKASADNSFDSVETMDTDGDVSDTSRPVDTTTSFESTTDNTDSTGDSQTHKLQQMKADSGYKSLESTAQPPKLSKKQIHFALDDQESVENEDEDGHSTDKSPMESSIIAMGIDSPAKRFKNGKQFERRNGRTASKKRREYSRERQIVQIYESINEPESDRSELPSGDSFEENSAPSKMSVFSRFFKSQSRERVRQLSRDFSIDEKTDAIFNEFLRPDASLGQKHTLAVRTRSPRLRPRLQRKHTEPMELYEYRRNKLVPEMRSASLGSDSSVGSSRRLSPQDSIEEEYASLVKDWDSPHGDANPVLRSEPVLELVRFGERSPSTIREIPIIQLPEEEIATSEV